MKQGLLLRNPCFHSLSPPSLPSFSFNFPQARSLSLSISASVDSTDTQELNAKERRRLRNERRESKTTTNWREEVEERLIKKPKKKKTSWTEELNLDNLAKLGPQWWVIRGSRVRGQDTAQLLARSLARNFPDVEFKLFTPAVHVKKRLKNGSYSITPKPLFPGCIFFRCVLNKELHDFIREYDGIGGFLGSKVGSIKRQINKPKPVSADDMEAIYRQAKEEQEKADQAFEEEEKKAVLNSEALKTELEPDSDLKVEAGSTPKPKRKSSKTSAIATEKSSTPKLGSTVRVLSGTFAGFAGTLKKLNRKTKIATVAFTLFGKENIVDIEASEIAPEIS